MDSAPLTPKDTNGENPALAEPSLLTQWQPLLLFLLIAAAGLFYVKWNPYYHKALLAASVHSIGTSIVSGKAATPPAPSWRTAWQYTAAYFKAVWQAVLLGLLLGSLIETLLPKAWLQRSLRSGRYRSTALAGLAAIPSMMCTCCAAPMAVGMRKQSVSAGAALAYWLGNPVLNPATLVFLGFVLSWRWVALRLFFALVLVFGVAFLAGRLAGEAPVPADTLPFDPPVPDRQKWLFSWLHSLGRLTLDTLPLYLLTVLLLGAFRAWLFPAIRPEWHNSFLVIAGLALAGALFIIPTAGEVPIVAAMLSLGLGTGPAGALLITLPAISVPSVLIVRKAFPARVLAFVSAAVVILGILAGLTAIWLFRT